MSNKITNIIYALSDPRNGTIKYIGKSTNGLKRARSHCYPKILYKECTLKSNWIKSLINQGFRPVIEIIEELINKNDLIEAEKFWISQFRALGFKLLNMTDGGEGALGRKMPEKQKEILRQANLGNKYTKGKKLNLNNKQRLELAERAKKRSADPIIRAKISKTLSGRKQSPETIAKRSKILKDKGCNKIISENGLVFKSQKEAAEAFNISPSYLCMMLNGKVPLILPLKRSS